MNQLRIFIATAMSFISFAQPSQACTALKFPMGSHFSTAVNMDWTLESVGTIMVNKRGYLKRDANLFDDQGANHLEWRSKYGSVSSTFFGREFPLGGVNEAGLIVHFLKGSANLPDMNSVTALTHMQLGQYLLDMAGSLDEAIQLIGQLRPTGRQGGGIHYCIFV